MPLPMQVAEALAEWSLGRDDRALVVDPRAKLVEDRAAVSWRVARAAARRCRPRASTSARRRRGSAMMRTPSSASGRRARAASDETAPPMAQQPGRLPPARSRKLVTLVPSHCTVRARSSPRKRRTLSESPLGE